MDIVLIGGLWLDSTAWDTVACELNKLGHRPVVVELPGAGDGNLEATLDDQLAAVLAAVDKCAEPPLVVGHSAAATLAWLAGDRRGEAIAGVVLVGGMPNAEGERYAPFFDIVDGGMPFPGWDIFAGPDANDLDEPTRVLIASKAHPVAQGVAEGVVHYVSEARKRVPVTLICPEFSPTEVAQWRQAGEMPELDGTDLELVNLDSGHWPMFSQPVALAHALADVADHRA